MYSLAFLVRLCEHSFLQHVTRNVLWNSIGKVQHGIEYEVLQNRKGMVFKIRCCGKRNIQHGVQNGVVRNSKRTA